jgi:hypothetical protein
MTPYERVKQWRKANPEKCREYAKRASERRKAKLAPVVAQSFEDIPEAPSVEDILEGNGVDLDSVGQV